MKKTDFYKLSGAYDLIDIHVFDYWLDWRKENLGDERIMENRRFDVCMGKVVIEYRDPDTGEDMKDEIPVSYFFEKDEDPEIKMLWHCGYYDGPISGIAEYNGEHVWFQVVEWEHDNLFSIRRYGLYRLSEKEISEESYWHCLFRRHVGHHCDYGDRYAPYAGGNNPNKFYHKTKKRPKRDYTKNECLDVFDECLFNRNREE